MNFTPNALGQPTLVQDLAPGGAIYAKEIKYYPNGSLDEFKYGNLVAYKMQQNGRQLPARTTHGSVTNLSYTYDGNANVESITDHLVPNHSRTMTYDGLNRLKTVESPMLGSTGAIYDYNQLNNITRVRVGGTHRPRDHFYCYDARNQLRFIRTASNCDSSPAATTLDYDAQGNALYKNGEDYDFDFGNRLREVIGVERYRYDAFGRRLLAMNFSRGTITSQYGQNGQLLFQKDERDGLVKSIDQIYLGGSLIAKRELVGASPATLTFYHTDALGSPVEATSAGGGLLERTEYEPFGDQLVATASIGKDRPGYAGHVRDVATNLSYMQQRYYDPEIGRFLSVDPLSTDSTTGENFNRYSYAHNNPYRFTDPDGREAADRAYGAAVGYMLRNDPERLRIWAGGEAAARMEGSSAEQGAMMGQAAGDIVDGGDYSFRAMAIAAAKAIVFKATHRRVNLRKQTREKIEANQPRSSDGQMVDPNTGQPLKPGEIDVGHKRGNEWQKRKAKHEAAGSSRKQVIEDENDPDIYQLEDRSSNRSRKFEDKEKLK